MIASTMLALPLLLPPGDNCVRNDAAKRLAKERSGFASPTSAAGYAISCQCSSLLTFRIRSFLFFISSSG